MVDLSQTLLFSNSGNFNSYYSYCNFKTLFFYLDLYLVYFLFAWKYICSYNRERYCETITMYHRQKSSYRHDTELKWLYVLPSKYVNVHFIIKRGFQTLEKRKKLQPKLDTIFKTRIQSNRMIGEFSIKSTSNC